MAYDDDKSGRAPCARRLEERSVAIKCPHCSRSINVRNASPGQYTPRCPKCTEQFALTVPPNPNDEWEVAALTPAAALKDSHSPGNTTNDLPDRNEGPFPGEYQSAVVNPPLQDTLVGNKAYVIPPDDAGRQKIPGISHTLVDEYKHDNMPSGPKTPANDSAEDHHTEETGAVAPAENVVRMPLRLGGYEVVRQLGRGAMGAVYLARQVSLDRFVALKVMNARWASDPIFLARFTREAYAAAQLVHHNVVQIYDIGQDKGLNFYSMEYVKGRSLGDVIQKEGKIEPAVAVGYTLQAARGLKFAHDRGMIHRDIKPDNLMLNEQGIVKVADLGLVKIPEMARDSSDEDLGGAGKESPSESAASSAGMTHANTTMGSPAFMSPEQCANAARVDHRADIYSLGCSLYMMLTGRTPFRGKNILDVMNKHATEAPVPPTQFVKTIPEEISGIILKTLEKSPAKRHRSLDELIHELERWLAAKTGGGFRPSEQQISTLENCVEQFNDSPIGKLRGALLSAGVALSAIGFVACLFLNPSLAIGELGMGSAYAITYFTVSGIFGRSYLFRMARPIIFGIRSIDWGLLASAVVLFVLILDLTGLLLIWLGFSTVGALLAMGVHLLLDKQVEAQQQEAIDQCENVFKRMRVNGFNEESLRDFVTHNTGRRWEEFFEALFGFEAKLIARAELGEEETKRVRHAVWREPILRWIDRVRFARDEVRERKHLESIEARMLEAQGIDREQAKEEAHETAAHMVHQAAEIKDAEVHRTRGEIDLESQLQHEPVNVGNILRSPGRPSRTRKAKARPYRFRFDAIFGWRMRFVLGVLLLAGGVLWERQHLDSFRQAPDENLVSDNTDSPKKKETVFVGILKEFVAQEESKPLTDSFLPGFVARCFDHINPLIAGLLVLLSVFSGTDLKAKMLLLAAAVVFAAHLVPIPDIGPVKPYQLSLIAGALLAIEGFWFGRKKSE